MTRWFVYGAQLAGTSRVKIGISQYVDGRLRDLSRQAGGEMEKLFAVPGTIELERALQSLFNCVRLRGEWLESTHADFIPAVIRAGCSPHVRRFALMLASLPAGSRRRVIARFGSTDKYLTCLSNWGSRDLELRICDEWERVDVKLKARKIGGMPRLTEKVSLSMSHRDRLLFLKMSRDDNFNSMRDWMIWQLRRLAMGLEKKR